MKNVFYLWVTAICSFAFSISGCSSVEADTGDDNALGEREFAAIKLVYPAENEGRCRAPDIKSYFSGQQKLLKTEEVSKIVATALSEQDKNALILCASNEKDSVEKILRRNLVTKLGEVNPDNSECILSVGVKSADKNLSVKLANLYAAAFVSYSHQMRIKPLMDSIDALRVRIEQQEAAVKTIDQKLVDFRVKNLKSLKLDEHEAKDREELGGLHSKLVSAKEALKKTQGGDDKEAIEKAQQVYDSALAALRHKQNEVIESGKLAIEYRALERERQVAESLHTSFIAAMNIRTSQINLADMPVIVQKAEAE